MRDKVFRLDLDYIKNLTMDQKAIKVHKFDCICNQYNHNNDETTLTQDNNQVAPILPNNKAPESKSNNNEAWRPNRIIFTRESTYSPFDEEDSKSFDDDIEIPTIAAFCKNLIKSNEPMLEPWSSPNNTIPWESYDDNITFSRPIGRPIKVEPETPSSDESTISSPSREAPNTNFNNFNNNNNNNNKNNNNTNNSNNANNNNNNNNFIDITPQETKEAPGSPVKGPKAAKRVINPSMVEKLNFNSPQTMVPGEATPEHTTHRITQGPLHSNQEIQRYGPIVDQLTMKVNTNNNKIKSNSLFQHVYHSHYMIPSTYNEPQSASINRQGVQGNAIREITQFAIKAAIAKQRFERNKHKLAKDVRTFSIQVQKGKLRKMARALSHVIYNPHVTNDLIQEMLYPGLRLQDVEEQTEEDYNVFRHGDKGIKVLLNQLIKNCIALENSFPNSSNTNTSYVRKSNPFSLYSSKKMPKSNTFFSYPNKKRPIIRYKPNKYKSYTSKTTICKHIYNRLRKRNTYKKPFRRNINKKTINTSYKPNMYGLVPKQHRRLAFNIIKPKSNYWKPLIIRLYISNIIACSIIIIITFVIIYGLLT